MFSNHLVPRLLLTLALGMVTRTFVMQINKASIRTCLTVGNSLTVCHRQKKFCRARNAPASKTWGQLFWAWCLARYDGGFLCQCPGVLVQRGSPLTTRGKPSGNSHVSTSQRRQSQLLLPWWSLSLSLLCNISHLYIRLVHEEDSSTETKPSRQLYSPVAYHRHRKPMLRNFSWCTHDVLTKFYLNPHETDLCFQTLNRTYEYINMNGISELY